MPKKIAQDVVQQVKQIAGETVKEAAKQPKEAADEAFEKLVSGGPQASGDSKTAASAQLSDQQLLRQKEKDDKLKSAREIRKVIQELNLEMEKYRKVREEQLKQRREQQEAEEKAKKEEEEKILGTVPQEKQSKVLAAGLRSRKRSSQPELSGSRRSG